MNETQTKVAQHKSSSLPRLRQQSSKPSSPQPRRKNKDIHKTRWSMAPKCLMQGHEGRDILYVCIDPQCDQLTRLVCETCFFKGHQKHSEQFLAIDQIKSGSIQRLRFWPFEQKYRKIFEFITAHESHVSNLIQDVNATFHGMAARIMSSIDKIRLDLLKKIDNFYLRETHKKVFCTKIKEELQRCFELKQIREIVRQLFSKEVKHEVFLVQMKQLLNKQESIRNRQLLQQYFNKAQKGTDMIFDQMHFLKKQNWIIQQIEQQKITLREAAVQIQETDVGIERILPQVLQYMDREAEGHYPLAFQKKIFEDGSQYTGFIQKGARAMFGRRRYKNGFVYYGQWKLNSKNGWGILQNKTTGYRYAGSWKEDKKNGYGREQTLTTIYEGNFLGDKKDGFGIFTQDGIRFQITWKADKKHGAGKKIQKNGIEHQIYYINGVQATGPTKSTKISQSFNLKQLTKRFGTLSQAQKTRSN